MVDILFMTSLRGTKLPTDVRAIHSKDWEKNAKAIWSIEKKSFPPKLRDKPKIIKAFAHDPAIILALYLGSESAPGVLVPTDIIGYLAAAPIESVFFARIKGPEGYKSLRDVLKIDETNYGVGDVFYVETSTVLTEYEKGKLETELEKAAEDFAKKCGYHHISSHDELGPSLRASERHGWKKIKEHKDWYGTGKTSYYMRKSLV
jgi:hypothetical protein